MVRATSIFSRLFSPVGAVASIVASKYAGRVGPRSTFSAWQMMNPWRRLSCHIAPVLVAAAIGLVGIELLDRGVITVMTNYHIVPPVVYPGQRAALRYTLQDFRFGCGGSVKRWIVDSEGVVHYLTNDVPSRPSDFQAGIMGMREVSKEVPIPFGSSAGRAIFHAQVTRWCNIFQEYLWPMVSEHTAEFHISREGFPVPPEMPGATNPPQR